MLNNFLNQVCLHVLNLKTIKQTSKLINTFGISWRKLKYQTEN